MQFMVFPSTGLQILSCMIHYFGVSIITYCVSCRLAAEDFSSVQSFMEVSWPRLCILLIFIDSWAFLFTSGILLFGVGLEVNLGICSMAILVCIIFYATSKLLIYAFLIEKVHVVWAKAGQKRFKSTVYIICFITVGLYAIVIALMFVGRIHYFREDGACIIGLKPLSSIPLLAYDFYITVFLTVLFLAPLLKAKSLNPRVKRVALRTLIASGFALTTSTVNVLMLTIFDGHERGWVCLGACGADVICNGLALFWVTGIASDKSTPSVAGASRPLSYRNTKKVESLIVNQPMQSLSPGLQKRDTVYNYMFPPPPVSKSTSNSPVDEQLPMNGSITRNINNLSTIDTLFSKNLEPRRGHSLDSDEERGPGGVD